MSIDDDSIYSIDAYRITPDAVARRFAAEYWDQPREIDWISQVNGETRFAVVDGSRVYRVIYRPWVNGQRPAMYLVAVVS